MINLPENVDVLQYIFAEFDPCPWCGAEHDRSVVRFYGKAKGMRLKSVRYLVCRDCDHGWKQFAIVALIRDLGRVRAVM